MTLTLRRLEASRVAVVFAASGADAGAVGLCNAAPLLLPSPDTTVYRFSGAPGKGPNSHFFSRDRAECYAVDRSGQCSVEGVPLYAAAANADGSCPTRRGALYRVSRPFGDSNHRFTTERSVVQQMVAKGWVDEGPAMCVLPSS